MITIYTLKRKISCFLFLLTVFSAQAQNSMKGKDFWLGFLQNYSNSEVTIFISSEVNTSGTVSIPLQSWSSPFSVTAGGITSVNIPALMVQNANSGITGNMGIHVTANDSITVFASNYSTYTSDASFIIPSHFLKTEYFVITYKGAVTTIPSDLLIVAIDDNTTIEIIPSVSSLNGHPAGIPFNVTLNAGQTYLLKSMNGMDLTGTRVRGKDQCNPFAVFSGVIIAYVPGSCSAGDHLYEQMIPINYWGLEYFAAPVNGPYTCVILASENNTELRINGGPIINLNAGGYYELNNQSIPINISSQKPVMVAQYLQGGTCSLSGDPSISILAPAEQEYAKVNFTTVYGLNLLNHYVNIVVKTQYVNQVVLNGTNIGSGFSPFPSAPGYSYKQVSIPHGNHTLEADSGLTAYVYGTGNYNSYFYSAGFKGEESLFDFEYDEPICSGSPVLFTATGNGITSWNWHFGDNTTATDSSVTHTFNSPGNYTVTLIINKQNSYCPDTIYHIINVPLSPVIDVVKDTIICGDSVIVINAYGQAISYLWSTGDTTSYLITGDGGIYWLETSNGTCSRVDTITIKEVEMPKIELGPDITICEKSTCILNSEGSNNLNYSWSTGETSTSISVIQEGLYWIKANNFCGSSEDSIMVKFNPLPQISAGNDTTVLLGTMAQLQASGGISYNWNPFPSLSCTDCPNPLAFPLTTTNYYVSVTNENECSAVDSVTVFIDADLAVYVPNIFSPDGNGQNDILFVRGKGVKSIHFMIYNRWGEKIFETVNLNRGWDGTYAGKELSPSVFVYYLDAILETNQRIIQEGDITLVK